MEVSGIQAGQKRGAVQASTSMSSRVSGMSEDELRSFCRVPDDIRLELSDGPAVPTVHEAENAIYFTKEQFAAGLRLPVSSLVKQFLHFSGAPPSLIHPNVIRILTGCGVLNHLYQLGLSMVEICFIYQLKMGSGGRLSLSAHRPWLQFVTGLPDSPKGEAKGVVLVKGPWFETPGSPGLPFSFNRSLVMPGFFFFFFFFFFLKYDPRFFAKGAILGPSYSTVCFVGQDLINVAGW